MAAGYPVFASAAARVSVLAAVRIGAPLWAGLLLFPGGGAIGLLAGAVLLLGAKAERGPGASGMSAEMHAPERRGLS